MRRHRKLRMEACTPERSCMPGCCVASTFWCTPSACSIKDMHIGMELSHYRHTAIQGTDHLMCGPSRVKWGATSTFCTQASVMKRAWRFCRQLRPLSLSMAVILSFEACAVDLNAIKQIHATNCCGNDA